jgi:hypothetical protein
MRLELVVKLVLASFFLPISGIKVSLIPLQTVRKEPRVHLYLL